MVTAWNYLVCLFKQVCSVHGEGEEEVKKEGEEGVAREYGHSSGDRAIRELYGFCRARQEELKQVQKVVRDCCQETDVISSFAKVISRENTLANLIGP